MALAAVKRMSFKMPGRGTVKFGVYTGTLTGYVNGTGIAMNASTFGLSSLLFVGITMNSGGALIAEWDPDTGYAKFYSSTDGTEAATNGINAREATVFYLGF